MDDNIVLEKPKRLTDDLVIQMRQACRNNNDISPRTLADQTGISVHTLSKAIRGDTYRHLDRIEAPYSQSPFKVKDSDVGLLRQMALTHSNTEVFEAFKHLGIASGTMEKIIRGYVYTHLNALYPPVLKPNKKTELMAQAQAMRKAGKLYDEICAALDVSKASVSHWCSDIVPDVEIVRKSSARKVDEEKCAVARARYLQGDLCKDIARDLNVCGGTIGRWCKGLERPVLVKAPVPKAEKIITNLAEPPYGDYRIYHTKDKTPKGRIVQLVLLQSIIDKSKIKMSLSRYRMAVHLGRVLTKDEIVKHREGYSDALDNLYLTTNAQRKIDHAERVKKACGQCGEMFSPTKSKRQYCSVACRGKADRGAHFVDRVHVATVTCTICHTPFTQKHSQQEICSRSCRSKAIAQAQANRPKKIYVNNCVICEEDFQTRTKNADVCLSACCRDVLKNLH